jgi:hypothetical protein
LTAKESFVNLPFFPKFGVSVNTFQQEKGSGFQRSSLGSLTKYEWDDTKQKEWRSTFDQRVGTIFALE